MVVGAWGWVGVDVGVWFAGGGGIVGLFLDPTVKN